MHGLEDKYSDKLDFVYLDIDEAGTEPIKRKLGYRVQPDFFLIDASGQVIQRWIGSIDAAALEQGLKQIESP